MSIRRRGSRGRLFVISAPSGCGKTTLCKRLLADKDLKLTHSVSMTTRPRRPDEKDGIDYRFVSSRYFQKLIDPGAFLEYEENFGNLYGTPKRFIEEKVRSGKAILLAIDVKGAMKVRREYPHHSILIFILPPSMKTLKKRLCSRMSDCADSVLKRLSLARREISYKDRYDYRVVNDRLDRAYKKLKAIIISEMRKERK